jgi:hypothetical protein
MFSRSFRVKNIPPKVPYLLHASARQWHYNTYTIFSLSPHSQQSCHSVNPGLNIKALRVVGPVNSPTATLSFSVLIAWSSFVLLVLLRVLDWRQPLQVFHLFRCSCLKRLLMTSLPTTKGMATVWSERTFFLDYQLHEFRSAVLLHLNYIAVTSREFYHLQLL